MFSPREESLRQEAMRFASMSSYDYDELPFESSFRVAELLPGNANDQVICRLHAEEWNRKPQFEAISYAWGDTTDRSTILCNGKKIHVTKSLYTALVHFRHKYQSRIIWADGLCINQKNIPERGLQVKQMKTIYEEAQNVLVWLGPDNEEQQAEAAVQAIHSISEFLCRELGISIWEHNRHTDTYQELIIKNKDKLPLPNETDISSKAVWRALRWFYSHRYFTRVWAIQEVTANVRCKVYLSHSTTTWNRIDLVACYLIMDQAFSKEYGFASSYCWYVATFAELIANPARWLNMLYLASNYNCADARDVIYGLRGLMEAGNGASLLVPDYNKSVNEVYRDCVETALINFKNTDVLLYVTGEEHPSWIPRWNVPMLFRNPFRFGKAMPWRPSGETVAEWSMDKATNTLSLSGFVVGEIEFAKSYNQAWFADSSAESAERRLMLRDSWSRILGMLGNSQSSLPLPQSLLSATATSLSFGLDHKLAHSEQVGLMLAFVAYLVMVLVDAETLLQQYIPADILESSKAYDGKQFGKPIWDFEYPEASIFVTKEKFIGCAVSTTQSGDVVFIPCGSTYPVILRPLRAGDGRAKYAIRGFSYIDGVMYGEQSNVNKSSLDIC